MNDYGASPPPDGIRAPPNTPISPHANIFPGNLEYFQFLTAEEKDEGEAIVFLEHQYYVDKKGNTLPIGTIQLENGDVVMAGGRHQGRKLVPWHYPRMFEKVLFHLIYELHRTGVAIPYDEVAERLSPGTTGGALQQALNKQRDQLLAEGHLIPPNLQRDDPLAHIIRGYVRDFSQNYPFAPRILYMVEKYADNSISLIPPSIVVGSGNNSKAQEGAMGAGRTKRAWRDEEQERENERAAAAGEQPRVIRRERVPLEQRQLEALLKSGKKLRTASGIALPDITPTKATGRKHGKAVPVKRTVVKKSGKGIKRTHAEIDDDEPFIHSDNEDEKKSVTTSRVLKPLKKKFTPESKALWEQLDDNEADGMTYAERFAAIQNHQMMGVHQANENDPSEPFSFMPAQSATHYAAEYDQDAPQEATPYVSSSSALPGSNGFGTPGLYNNNNMSNISSPYAQSPLHSFNPIANSNENDYKYRDYAENANYAADMPEEFLQGMQYNNIMNAQANNFLPFDAGVVGPLVSTTGEHSNVMGGSTGGFSGVSGVSNGFNAIDFGRGINVPPPQFILPQTSAALGFDGHGRGDMQVALARTETLDPDYSAAEYPNYYNMITQAATFGFNDSSAPQIPVMTNAQAPNNFGYSGTVSHADITSQYARHRHQFVQNPGPAQAEDYYGYGHGNVPGYN